MAINFTADQTVLNSQLKTPVIKVVKLTFANFTTTNTDTLLATIPADASVISFRSWVKTALTGNSVATPTLALGTASGGAQWMAAHTFPAGTAGAAQFLTPVLLQDAALSLPLGSDQQIWGRGACATGNPTAGEMYLVIEYVR